MGEKDHSDRSLHGAGGLTYVPLEAIRRIRRDVTDPIARAQLVADICRVNTLYMIMNAGSGHIGSSFSSLDVITWLCTEELSDPNSGVPGADTYFSSKGHDAPALYSLLIALEKLDFDLIHRLRRFPGLPGHPDVATPYIAANTGSLGMGISKAYGMARAQRLTGGGGRIVVMTGDGELQEGQIWESLQPAANEKLGEITVIVDHNKYQSDQTIAAVSDLGRLDEKFHAFGWAVRRVSGHDLPALRGVFRELAAIRDQPKVVIADTIKGRGVSFMEGVAHGDETYHFHAGAPSLNDYMAAVGELVTRINSRLEAARSAAAGPGWRAAAAPGGALEPGTAGRGVRGGAAPDRPRTRGDRRPRCRSAVGLRYRSVQGGAARSIHRMRHRRAAHGVGRRRAGAEGPAADRAFVRMLSIDPRERADLQQCDRAQEDHLRRHACGRGAGRARTLAPVGPRHLGRWIGARADGDRALQREGSPARHSMGGPGESARARTCGSSTFRSIFRTRSLRYMRCRSAAA